MIGNVLAIWPTPLTPSVSSVRDKHHMSSRAARLRQHCVNGDGLSQWEMANFGPLQNPNPLTDCQKYCHSWLRPLDDPLY